MSYPSVFLCVLAGTLLASIFFVRKKCILLRDERAEQYELLRERLHFYSLMNEDNARDLSPSDLNAPNTKSFIGMWLSKEEHAILLGALKKVEAKLVAVIAVVVFALPSVLGLGKYLWGHAQLAGGISFFAMGLLFVVLAAAVDGTKHFGQAHYRSSCRLGNGLGDGKCAMSIRGRELQEVLMKDLLRKEADYDSAVFVFFAVMIALAAAAIVALLASWSDLPLNFCALTGSP